MWMLAMIVGIAILSLLLTTVCLLGPKDKKTNKQSP
jgi:hypothetical protein